MGRGRVRMKIPRRAHRPPTNWEHLSSGPASPLPPPVISSPCQMLTVVGAHSPPWWESSGNTRNCPEMSTATLPSPQNMSWTRSESIIFFFSIYHRASQWVSWRLWGGEGARVLYKPGSGCKSETAAQRNVWQVWKSSLSSSHEQGEWFCLNIFIAIINISSLTDINQYKWEFNGCYSI